MPEVETLRRRGCHYDESHPTSMGTEEDSRRAVHDYQVGIQQCRQNPLGVSLGRGSMWQRR